jgi:hypothetical protein
MLHIRLFSLVCFGLSLVIGCADATLEKYKADSPDETAIQAVLLRFQDAMNARDPRAAEPLLHEDLKAMIGRNRRIVSKHRYLETFAERMGARPISVLGPPKIAVIGNRASVKVVKRTGTVETDLTFELVRDQQDEWLILSWRY